MKKIFISIAALALTMSVSAQSSLGVRLNHKAKIYEMQKASAAKGSVAPAAETVTVIGTLKDGVECPTEELNALGVKIKNQFYGMVVMEVNVDQLEALGNVEAFKVINANNTASLRNNVSHQLTGVDKIQDPNNPEGLTQIYTGKDVIVGVIDGGFDYQHKMYKDDAGNTRIKKVWQDGEEKTDIASLTTDNTTGSHGSHTTGTAAGSDNGVYTRTDGTTVSGQRGVAYESDILLSSGLSDANIMASVTKMWDYAKSQNKPLVINMSLGENDAWMDGHNTYTTFLKGITNSGTQEGLLINIAAGNEGNDNKSFFKTVPAGQRISTAVVFGEKESEIQMCSEDETAFDVIIMGWDAKNDVVSAVQLDKDAGTVFEGLTYTRGKAAEHNNRYYYILKGVEKLALPTGVTALSITISAPADKECKVRFNGNEIKCSNTLSGVEMPGLFKPNDDNSLNNMIQHKYAFAVGAYTSTKSVVLLDGTSTKDADGGDVGSFANFTSWSEVPYNNDVDNIGVDFLSPGSLVVSSVNHYNTENGEIVAKNGDNWLGVMEGTSMATPNASGIMALWLQAKHTLSINEVRSIIKETADNDDYTKADQRRAGAGRINCLKGIQKILGTTSIEEITAINKSKATATAFKISKNGKLVIVKDGKEFNAVGAQLN